MKNDNHDDVFGPDGPQVEPTLLLQYLLQKAEELAHKNYAGFPLPFRLLGAVALIPFPKLQTDFRQIVSPSDDSLKERAEKCKNLFVDALARPQDSNFYASKGGEEMPFYPVLSNRFCWEARRLGERMVEEKDFQYVSVWLCMTWIALQGDTEKLKDFQDKCLLYPDPEERIEQVIPILWAAMTRKVKEN